MNATSAARHRLKQKDERRLRIMWERPVYAAAPMPHAFGGWIER